MLGILCWSLAPIVFMVMASFKPGQDIFAVPARWQFTPTLQHYASLWTQWPGFFDGLLNSLIVTAGATVLVILMRTFIDQIPYELDEAAMVDGASRAKILWIIIRPLARQGMMAVSVFVIVYAWNEFLFAFIFTSTKAKTAPLVIAEMMGSLDGVDWGVLFAASTVQLLPVLLFVMLMQKHLVAGLTGGAVKG